MDEAHLGRIQQLFASHHISNLIRHPLISYHTVFLFLPYISPLIHLLFLIVRFINHVELRFTLTRPTMPIAFCSPLVLLSGHSSLRSNHGSFTSATARPRCVRRSLPAVRMMADDGEGAAPAEQPREESLTSASGILKILRDDTADYEPTATPRANLGVTRDADGKSNVWPVEPVEAVDQKKQPAKLAILGAVFACVAFALLVLPQLPFTNGDQF